MRTYVRIVEERVHAPWERLAPPVEEIVGGDFGEFTAVLLLDVLDVSGMFSFGVVDPCNTGGNYITENMNKCIEESHGAQLTGGNTDVEASVRYKIGVSYVQRPAESTHLIFLQRSEVSANILASWAEGRGRVTYEQRGAQEPSLLQGKT